MYTFYAPFMQGALTDGDYIAVVAYADGADNMFHVFDSSASGGKMAFQSEELGGNSGGWTVAAVFEEKREISPVSAEADTLFLCDEGAPAGFKSDFLQANITRKPTLCYNYSS